MDPPRFAKFDERSRTAKARKIAVLAGIARPEPGASMLYFGSRSNDFAAYFSKLGFGYSGTFAVDAVDTGQVGSGYQFTEIVGTKLPFPDERRASISQRRLIRAGLLHCHRRTGRISRCLRLRGARVQFPDVA